MTEFLPRPEVILTHESDLDGLIAGVLLQRLARKVFDIDVRLEACNYNYWKQRELREKAGWVTDLMFEPRLDKANWLVIDHHVTDARPKQAMLIHDVNKSAGLLCYELCRQHGLSSPELDRLVHLNNVGDLFLEDLRLVVQRLVAAGPQDRLAQPLQPEHEKQRSDDKLQQRFRKPDDQRIARHGGEPG